MNWRERQIGGPFDNSPDGPGGWWIIVELELPFDSQIVVPDRAGWRRKRIPKYQDTAYFTLAPDWVCEVLSTTTREHDRQRNRPVDAAATDHHLWLIDPAHHTLETFELRDGEWVLIATAENDDPVSIGPCDAITFSRGDLWP